MTSIPHSRPKAPRTALALLGVGALAGATVLAGAPAHAADASSTLTVHAAQTVRPVTHVASGSLYGLADATTPSDVLAAAVSPSEFMLKPSGGAQQSTGDILVTAPRTKALGAKVVDRLPDYLAGWPYQFSWSTWDSVVTNELAKVNPTTVPNLAAYAPWNEADNTWRSANGTFEAFWTHTYNLIRSIDSSTPIQGPSFSDNISDMENFLTNAVDTNTVPDILAWHELETPAKIQTDIATVEALEDSLGITRRPIDIEEYASTTEVGIPGSLVGYIAKFERLGVRNAELAFWNESGTLGDLLTSRGGSPNAAYWLYTWYAEQSGNVVTTTPYSSTSIDGEAALTSDGKELSVIFGGGSSGSSAVQIDGISSTLAPGGQVHVKLEQTVNTGRTTASPGPSTISEGDYTVTNGALTIPVTTDALNAYRVVLTPVGSSSLSTLVAGTYKITNANSGLVLGVQGMSTGSGASVIQWTDNGTSDHQWNVVSAGNGQYKIQNVHSGLFLGIKNASTNAGATALQWSDNGTSDHLWTIEQVAEGLYKIRNVNSGLLLGITGASTGAGATALQWTDSGTSDHLWALTSN